MAPNRLPIPLQLLLATALYTSTATSMPANTIFTRQDTCASSCPSTLPDDFCCKASQSCIPLAGNTTAVCCPKDKDCTKIKIISCDVKLQDPSNGRNSEVMTSLLDLELSKCGEKCCPFGYTCTQGKNGLMCRMDDDQSRLPDGAVVSSTSTAVPSATSTDIESVTGAPSGTSLPGKAGQDDDDDDDDDSDNSSASGNSGPATTSIIGGIVGGCLLLLILAIIIFLYIRRRNKRNDHGTEKASHLYNSGRRDSSIASFGNFISEPINQPNSYRADFILKTSPQVSEVDVPSRQPSTRVAAQPPRIRISIPNPFESPNPSPKNPTDQPSPLDDQPARHGNVRLPPIRAMKAQSHCSRRPATPELQREPSSECINVFADPSTVVKPRRLTHATTFTDLMDEADLGEVRRGRPYVPGTTPRI